MRECFAHQEQMSTVAIGGTASRVRALMGADAACVFETMRSSDAASNDGFQPALCLAVQLASLAYEVLALLLRATSKVLCTAFFTGFFPPPAQSHSGVNVDIWVEAEQFVSGFC